MSAENSSKSSAPLSSSSNSSNFFSTSASETDSSGSVLNASKISGSSRVPLPSSSKRLKASLTSFLNSPSFTSRTELRPRPILFAKLESMYLLRLAIRASTAGPPVSRQHTNPSQQNFLHLSLLLITGILKPVLWLGSFSRYPSNVSPNSWQRHAISKNESDSPGCA